SISKAYESTDHAILSEASNLGHGGSTAVTAILINGQRLLVANVGDSRAVLSRGGQAVQMSTDHEPSTERSSIEDRGDVPRVNGQLVVSRAFGDKSLKSHLRSDPDVREANIDNSTDILILASDVLWKVMSNQEAVDIAKKSRNPHKVARQLTTEAVHRDSKDDISCVVIRFRG
ncbi:Probable protein phosphatase 2C 10, partial [Linum perenne]